ncbi:hypothetical protein GQX73_g5140 [Xylaria multiplex]|uniref:Prp 4 CRoW domain-containing protein n=1 Tax=Xylaria multiplex TaxID=323545 RepID=A0A7C8IQ17_9PEZI|nr:hypothetical protein GQX73_g5140 [Xylaria multiplex]
MIYSVAYTLLAVGLVSQTLAEPAREPYQPKFARMSTRSILGLQRRAPEGYSPTEQLCGVGDTCAEACGKGFSQCASKDGLAHCYNRLKKQTCCPNGRGDSCDNGYFCTADDDGETWCCPDGLSLKECAQKYDIPGSLTSQVPSTTKTTTKATATKETSSEASNTSETTTTKEASTKTSHASTTESAITSTKSRKPATPDNTESASTTKTVHRELTSKSKSEETSTASPSESTTTLLVDVSSALVTTAAINTQATILDSTPSSTPSASPSTSSVSENGSGRNGPTNGLVFSLAGVLLAALV